MTRTKTPTKLEKMENHEMFTSKIDIPVETREKIISMLNQQLADMFDLYSQTKHAHWNVKGPNFFMLHELFDKLAEKLEKSIDKVAERATALSGIAMGTVRMAAGASRLSDFSTEACDGLSMVEKLAGQYAKVAASTRAAAHSADEMEDLSTTELLTALSLELDKALWFLESHLQE